MTENARMTTFFMGSEYGMTVAQGVSFGFWTDGILLCNRHTRGMRLQPFTEYDREEGFGKQGCPFCKGGELHGKFSKHRSRKAIERALDTLEANNHD